MTGCHNGVAAWLTQRQPSLISTHCVAHRLALAASQARDDVPHVSNTFKPTLQQLFYFYENSPVRMAGLKAIEQLLQTKELKLKKSADTRWLSVDNACQTLVDVLPAVITSLESKAEERGQALAHGLCKVVKQFKFIATLYMMCDVLPVVSHLSRILQYADIDLSVLQKLESTTIKEHSTKSYERRKNRKSSSKRHTKYTLCVSLQPCCKA